MDKKKKIRRICNVLMAVLTTLFLLSLLWFLNGSLEMYPTAEQQHKVRIASALFMFIFSTPCITCIVIRVMCVDKKEDD